MIEFIPVKRFYTIRQLSFLYSRQDRTMCNYVIMFCVPYKREGKYKLSINDIGFQRLEICIELFELSRINRRVIGNLENKFIKRLIREFKKLNSRFNNQAI